MATSTEDLNIPEGFLVAPRVPQGLAAAVEGLTREVIRQRPEDIYVFAAHHFEKLLQLREQYGVSRSLSVDQKNLQALRDMSKALRKRDAFKEEKHPRDIVYQSGWSLNETAKVLDRHRSIFGDEGKKITTEEVRQLASEKEKGKSEHFGRHRSPGKRNYRRKEEARESPRKSRSSPKIISQIPTLPGHTVKDIKSELRKNRISSRERRNLPEKAESEVLKHSARRSLEETEKMESQMKEKKRKSSERKNSRCFSVDRVKDYVMQKFATTKSLEELQSPTYVEKVQEVIDETAPIIKDKVEELKNSMSLKRLSRRSDRSSVSKEQSTSKESSKQSRSDQSNGSKEKLKSDRSKKIKKTMSGSKVSDIETPNDSLEDVETLKSEVESIGSRNALETRLNETQTLLEGISSAFTVPVRRSSSTSSVRDIRNQVSETSDVCLPVVRPVSSKSHSRSVSRSDSDNLVLPPISPEAPKSTKIKEDLVLPMLSPPGSAKEMEMKVEDEGVSRSVEKNTDEEKAKDCEKHKIDREGDEGEQIKDKKEDKDESENKDSFSNPEVLKGADLEVEEVFRDSLNVTPEPVDVPLRPDSLDPEEEIETARDGPSGLKEQLLEIQKVEKEIERVLNPGGNQLMKGQVTESSFKDKLQEIEDSERRIKGILVESEKEVEHIVKDKLKELEEMGKKIYTILDEPGKAKGVKDSNPKDEVERIEVVLNRENKEMEICKTFKDSDSECEKILSEGKRGESSSGFSNEGESKSDEENKKHKKITDDDRREKKYEVENKIEKKEKSEGDKFHSSSTKSIPYSYVLTEGSPHEIPDSVTTVVIPDRVPTPDSDTLEVVIEDGQICTKLLSTNGKNLEDEDQKRKEKLKKSEVKESSRNLQTSQYNLEVFGEVVQPESGLTSSINLDLIKYIESNHELMISHQDLDQIKEEDDKDLDQIKEEEKKHDKEEIKQIEKEVLQVKEEDIKKIKEEDKEDFKEKLRKAEGLEEKIIDEEELKVLKLMTSALEEIEEKEEKKLQLRNEDNKASEIIHSLPEALRLTDSESTDETKETSITDEIVEVTYAVENSLEIGESTGRSIESTNEIKETTITDHFMPSFSLDPGIPIVPELNLDSLQDLTISSFKTTDEETDSEKKESEETESAVSITGHESDKLMEEEMDVSKSEYNMIRGKKKDGEEVKKEESKILGKDQEQQKKVYKNEKQEIELIEHEEQQEKILKIEENIENIDKVQKEQKELGEVPERNEEIGKVAEQEKEEVKNQNHEIEVVKSKERNEEEIEKVQEKKQEVGEFQKQQKEVFEIEQKKENMDKVQKQQKEISEVQKEKEEIDKVEEQPKEDHKAEDNTEEMDKTQKQQKELDEVQDKKEEMSKAPEPQMEKDKDQNQGKEMVKSEKGEGEREKVQNKKEEIGEVHKQQKEVFKIDARQENIDEVRNKKEEMRVTSELQVDNKDQNLKIEVGKSLEGKEEIENVQEKKEAGEAQKQQKEVLKIEEGKEDIDDVQKKKIEIVKGVEENEEIEKIQEKKEEVGEVQKQQKEEVINQEQQKEVFKIEERKEDMDDVQKQKIEVVKGVEENEEIEKVQEKKEEVGEVQEQKNKVIKDKEQQEVIEIEERKESTDNVQAERKKVNKVQVRKEEIVKVMEQSNENFKVGDNIEEINKIQEREKEIEKIEEEDNELSDKEKLKEESSEAEISEREETPQKEDSSELIESRSASQCTTRRLSSAHLRTKEEILVIEDEKETKTDLLAKKEEIESEKIPKAGVVTNAISDEKLEKKKEYHIYVPEFTKSSGSSSDTSTFNSAATKIQAGKFLFLMKFYAF